MDPPAELERLAQRALDISDEMATGLDLDAARVLLHRIAVGGRTEEECLQAGARCRRSHYRNMRITVQHPKTSSACSTSSFPGSPWRTPATCDACPPGTSPPQCRRPLPRSVTGAVR